MLDVLKKVREAHRARIKKLEAEVERLQNDVDRYMTIANEHVNEVERLRSKFREIDDECPRAEKGWIGQCFQSIRDIVAEALGEQGNE